MNPSWYDLLDVEPDATADEIRAAWRSSIQGLDPTDRRFTVRNQAAAVLLDPEKRATYDAELADAGDRATDQSSAGEPVVETPSGVVTRSVPTPQPTTRQPRRVPRRPDPTVAPEEQAQATDTAEPVRRRRSASAAAEPARRPIPAWLLSGLAVVTAVVAIAAAVLYATSDSEQSVADATQSARDTAEQAVVPLFSFSYKSVDADLAAADAFLTPTYRDDTFNPAFKAVISQNAAGVKPVSTSVFVDSAVVNAQADRVDVLVFFNQTTSNAGRPPQTAHQYATLRMKQLGGDWLVSDIITQAISS